MHTPPALPDRQDLIRQARHAWLDDGATPAERLAIEPWITRSWQRCLRAGLHPEQTVGFDAVGPNLLRRTQDESQALVQAARPALQQLTRAIAGTRYFSLLTNAQGVVVDVQGPVDRQCRASADIARVGLDLSEAAVGTTAIGAALTELQPVWLHRGEHFFSAHGVYSCAGAPLFGPDGRCVGMLDLTGVDVPERPELRLLAARAAHAIENALMQQHPWALLLRLNWPGSPLPEGPPGESDGLLGLDEDGCVTGLNPAARQMLPLPLVPPGARLHASDLLALPWPLLFDHARRRSPPLELPLWSGLRLLALPRLREPPPAAAGGAALPLKDLETALIRQAVDDARGNVAEAAQRLGISRATVYRKLGRKKTAPQPAA